MNQSRLDFHQNLLALLFFALLHPHQIRTCVCFRFILLDSKKITIEKWKI